MQRATGVVGVQQHTHARTHFTYRFNPPYTHACVYNTYANAIAHIYDTATRRRRVCVYIARIFFVYAFGSVCVCVRTCVGASLSRDRVASSFGTLPERIKGGRERGTQSVRYLQFVGPQQKSTSAACSSSASLQVSLCVRVCSSVPPNFTLSVSASVFCDQGHTVLVI